MTMADKQSQSNPFTPTKILVTGGAGFIGSQVVKTLVDTYDALVRVMHLPNDNLVNLNGLDVELFPGDVTKAEDVDKAIEGCDVVFHLAAVYALWLPDMSLMDRVNIDGTRRVFDYCLKHKVKRVVYTSSFAVFAGQGLDQACTEESSFKLDFSHYSRTKYESHKIAKEYADRGLDLVIVCPTCPLGPGDYGPTPTGRILTDAYLGPVMFGIKTESNYVDVRDCAKGHVLALERGRTGESYLLGGENYTHHDLMRRLQRITGVKKRMVVVAPDMLMPMAKATTWIADHVTNKPPFTTPVEIEIAKRGLIADAGKARRELGLTTRPIEETVKDAIAWFVQHGYIRHKDIRGRFLHYDYAAA